MLSEKIKELRVIKGKTQKEISEYLGIQQNTYSQYENRNREPNYDVIIKLAKYYNVSTDYLLGAELKETLIKKIERKLNNEQKTRLEMIVKATFPDEYEKIKDTQ